MPKKFWYILVGSLIAIIVLPLAIDWLIIGNNFPSNISNSDWVGFLGGYVGSILGCAISLVGIIWTINFTREQNRTDRELQIRPYFDIRYASSCNMLHHNASWLGYVEINEFDEKDNELQHVERGLLFLRNIGNGPAANINVEVSIENIKVEYQARFNNQNTKVTSNSVQQGEENGLSVFIMNNRIAPTKDDLTWNENGFADFDHSKYKIPSNYKFTVILSYNDLLGNLFSQELKFNVNYYMELNKENGGTYHCDVHLNEIGVPKKR